MTRSLAYGNGIGRLETFEGRSNVVHIATVCEAEKQHIHDPSMPLNVIVTNTEFRRDVESRDVESCGDSMSDAGSSSKRVNSTEEIWPHKGPSSE